MCALPPLCRPAAAQSWRVYAGKHAKIVLTLCSCFSIILVGFVVIIFLFLFCWYFYVSAAIICNGYCTLGQPTEDAPHCVSSVAVLRWSIAWSFDRQLAGSLTRSPNSPFCLTVHPIIGYFLFWLQLIRCFAVDALYTYLYVYMCLYVFRFVVIWAGRCCVATCYMCNIACLVICYFHIRFLGGWNWHAQHSVVRLKCCCCLCDTSWIST